MQSSTLEIPLDDTLFKVLSSDSRREILRLLQERRMTGTELAQRLDLGKPAVSEHLKRLHEAGLVDRHDDPERRWVYFSLSKKGRDILEPKRTRFILVLSVALAALLLGSLLGVALYGMVESPAQPIHIDPTGGGDAYGSGLAGGLSPSDVEALGNGTFYIFRAEDVDLHNGTIDRSAFHVVHEPVTAGAREPTNEAPGPDAPSPEQTTDTPTTPPGPGAPSGLSTGAIDRAVDVVKGVKGPDTIGAATNATTDATNSTTVTDGGAVPENGTVDTGNVTQNATAAPDTATDDTLTDPVTNETSRLGDTCVETLLVSCPAAAGDEADGTEALPVPGDQDAMEADPTDPLDANRTADAASDAVDAGVDEVPAGNATVPENATAQANATADGNATDQGVESPGNATEDANTTADLVEPEDEVVRVPETPALPDLEGLLGRLTDAPAPPAVGAPVDASDRVADAAADDPAAQEGDEAAGRQGVTSPDDATRPGLASEPSDKVPTQALVGTLLALTALGLLLWRRRR